MLNTLGGVDVYIGLRARVRACNAAVFTYGSPALLSCSGINICLITTRLFKLLASLLLLLLLNLMMLCSMCYHYDYFNV